MVVLENRLSVTEVASEHQISRSDPSHMARAAYRGRVVLALVAPRKSKEVHSVHVPSVYLFG